MAKNTASRKVVEGCKKTAPTTSAVVTKSHSAIIAAEGVTDSSMFAKLMSALMSDVLSGNVTTEVANATVNAGGKLLKVVEFQHRFGSTKEQPRPKILQLTQ